MAEPKARGGAPGLPSYAWTVAAQLLGRFGNTLANLLALGLAARVLPSAQFADFGLVTGILLLLAQLADFGSGPVFGQYAGTLPAQARGAHLPGRYWGSFLALRGALAGLATLSGLICAVVLPGRVMPAMALASLAAGAVAARVLDPLFQVAGVPFRSTTTHLAGAAGIILGAVLAALLHPTLMGFLWGTLAANAVYVLAALYAARDLIAGPSTVDFAMIRQIAKLAAPIGVAGVLTALNGRANLFFLAQLPGTDGLANYTTASRILDLGVNFAVVALWPLLPIFSAAAQQGPAALAATLRPIISKTLQISLPLLVAAPSLSPLVLRILYGPHYAAAAPVLAVLALVAFGVVFSLLISYALLALQITRFAIWVTGTAACANILCNAVLVPGFGAMGAAMSAAGSECLLVGLAALLLHRSAPGAWAVRRILAMFALAAATAFGLHAAGPQAGPILACLVAATALVPLMRARKSPL